MRSVEVTWLDSVVGERWATPDTLKGVHAATCVSLGYLVDENEHAITLAQSIGTGENGADEYGQPITIPRCAINAIRTVGLIPPVTE